MTSNTAKLSLLIAATVFFSSTLPIPASAQSVSFIARKDFAVGSRPQSMAVGDFNGDGVLDLATANQDIYATSTDNDVKVLLGNGDGTFQPAQRFTTGGVPRSVAVGDVNGDGRLDLAVANYSSNAVSVLVGNGDGTFQPAQSFAVGTYPISVAVGDVNGDGRLDLAVANYYDPANNNSGTVSVLVGNGDGTFQPAQSFAVGSPHSSVALGDVNGDGRLDLAVANNGDPYRDQGSVSVLLGNGDGTFQPAQSFAVGRGPVSVAAGEVNGDGRLDLALASGSNTVSVLLGNGDGTFQVAPTFVAGAEPTSVAVGDFNGDGKTDLAVANGYYNSPNTVSVLLGNSDRSFQPALTFGTGVGPRSVGVGDFNGDGRPDLVVANYCSSDVSVLLGNGIGRAQWTRTCGTGRSL